MIFCSKIFVTKKRVSTLLAASLQWAVLGSYSGALFVTGLLDVASDFARETFTREFTSKFASKSDPARAGRFSCIEHGGDAGSRGHG